jgi:hypothetical protein
VPRAAPPPAAPAVLARGDRDKRIEASEPTAAKEPTWIGVAASHGRHGVTAAWTRKRVFFSRDGGKSFAPVLDGNGRVDDVAIDSVGTLFVRRGTSLGVLTSDDHATWHPLPFANQTVALAAGKGVVAWLGWRDDASTGPKATLAVSRDDGGSWALLDPPALGDFRNELVIADDGTASLMVGEEADCGGGWQQRFVGTLDGAGKWTQATWPLDAPGTWSLGAGGWTYALGDCGDGNDGRLCGVAPDGKATVIAPVQRAAFASFAATTDGRATWATLDGKLAWLGDAVVMFPAKRTPKGLALQTIDADGRPVGIAGGTIVRFGTSGKWEKLFG